MRDRDRALIVDDDLGSCIGVDQVLDSIQVYYPLRQTSVDMGSGRVGVLVEQVVVHRPRFVC